MNPWQKLRRIIPFSTQWPAWHDDKGHRAAKLHWMMTELCPYSCAYCFVPRHKLATVAGASNHAFRNHPVEAWLQGFRRHFQARRLSLLLSGGEPMADRKSLVPLVNGLSAIPSVVSIQINTNAYWEPARYADMDRSKVILNCAFHIGQTETEPYFARMRRMVSAGFRVGIVNYVMTEGRAERFREFQARFRDLGIPLNPNPDMHTRPAPAERRLLARELPALDYKYKVLRARPQGQLCMYPCIGYQMDYAGRVHVGCHPLLQGHFFDAFLPRQPECPVPCPSQSCGCRDQYCLLQEAAPQRGAAIDQLDYYSRMLFKRQTGASDNC